MGQSVLAYDELDIFGLNFFRPKMGLINLAGTKVGLGLKTKSWVIRGEHQQYMKNIALK